MKSYLKKAVQIGFILCCFVMVGCGKKDETAGQILNKTEEPAANDDIMSEEIQDLNENQQIQGESDEGQQAVTVSLLGKYDISIENDRIHIPRRIY